MLSCNGMHNKYHEYYSIPPLPPPIFHLLGGVYKDKRKVDAKNHHIFLILYRFNGTSMIPQNVATLKYSKTHIPSTLYSKKEPKNHSAECGNLMIYHIR